MKLAEASDIHLEFGDLALENTDAARVLILSGDICVVADLDHYVESSMPYVNVRRRSQMIHGFFQQCATKFEDVVYVVGNHEHYHYDFKYTVGDLKSRLAYLPNIHVLEKESVKIEDVTFIGATVWTDFNREDPITLMQMKNLMNEFATVKNSHNMVSQRVPLYEDGNPTGEFTLKEYPAKFTPTDALRDHREALAYIDQAVGQVPPGEKVVVVAHHTPTTMSCHPKYAGDYVMNGGYHSDLSDFILDRPNITLWTHGHTHEPFDYMVGPTRVVCNPRGYHGYEPMADNFTLKYLEI